MDDMQKLALPMNPTPAILKVLLEAQFCFWYRTF